MIIFRPRRVQRLARIVSAMTGITAPELMGAGRSRHLAYARFAIAYAARKAGMSYPEIGRCMGNRDHTTIMHADKQAAKMCKLDPCFATRCRILISAI